MRNDSVSNRRPAIAVVVGLLVALAVITPLAWLINTRDWGILVMFVVPFAVWGLIWLGRRLAEWAGVGPPP
ncbi:hypothetical protein BDK63_000492 [Halomonas campaniensis]|uniref:DUF4175 domain-containing protein n=1 Tax=Halomonas campaniensis TaxID=213554 RepID=A0A7W5K0E8_9GAMM|nr:hypothetical protein [Halomonas campaniensis]MBB3329652.1 hypothetical protein [Halomonas campaniensis]